MSAPFEERSGVVPCATPWGCWYQTLEEVFIEVQVPPGTRAKDVRCCLQSQRLALSVQGQDVLQGKLFDSTIADEGTWTLGMSSGGMFRDPSSNYLFSGVENEPPNPKPVLIHRIIGEGTPKNFLPEDRKLIRIILTKTNRDAGNCWASLLENEYAADPWVQDQMQRKLTLERFQKENPGFDFSGAEISGNYSKGGPDFSSLEN